MNHPRPLIIYQRREVKSIRCVLHPCVSPTASARTEREQSRHAASVADNEDVTDLASAIHFNPRVISSFPPRAQSPESTVLLCPHVPYRRHWINDHHTFTRQPLQNGGAFVCFCRPRHGRGREQRKGTEKCFKGGDIWGRHTESPVHTCEDSGWHRADTCWRLPLWGRGVWVRHSLRQGPHLHPRTAKRNYASRLFLTENDGCLGDVSLP